MGGKSRVEVPECRQVLSDLIKRTEILLTELDRKVAIDAEVLKLGYQINAEYAQYEGLVPGSVTTSSEERLQERIGPIKARIRELKDESQAVLDDIHALEREARRVVANCARGVPTLTPLLHQFGEIYGSRFAPDLELLNLRALLAEAQEKLGPVSPAQMPPPSESIPSTAEVAEDPIRRQLRGPNLELHRGRLRLWDQLAAELAGVWRATRKYTTLQALKMHHPDFEIWRLLSDREQQELLDGQFNPRSYAGNLVLQKYGLKSIETLRKSRKIVRRVDSSRH
jgi:hypothetical protein